MAEVILHQYANSPFSQKVRAIFGLKRMRWHAVEIPMILPKPDLIALTGGYRRTPVLQVGADIYCDTERIVREIERLAPAPPLLPPACAATAAALAAWADGALFQASAVLFSQRAVLEALFAGHDDMRRAFVADRVAMRKDAPGRRPTPAEAQALVATLLAQLDVQLADGRAWVLGSEPTLADFCLYHPLWFIRLAPVIGALLPPFAHVQRWMAAIDALGRGDATPLAAADAIAVARAAAPAPLDAVSVDTAFTPGDAVEVLPADYALDPVAGELVQLAFDGIAVRRVSDRAGELVVHFPRANYAIRRAGEAGAGAAAPA